jgi:hypothetical protein
MIEITSVDDVCQTTIKENLPDKTPGNKICSFSIDLKNKKNSDNRGLSCTSTAFKIAEM